jgi:hypothetical protein
VSANPESPIEQLQRARRVIASLEAETRGLRRELDSLRVELQPRSDKFVGGEHDVGVTYPPGVPTPGERR